MKTHSKKQLQTGFTLYELMITLLVVGIILSYGIVNLGDYTRNSRMTSTANDLHAAFHLARSESARAKANITICASANPMADPPACGGTWDQGYIVFQDDLATDLQVDGGEAILRRHDAAERDVNLNFTNGALYFSYGPTGLGRGDVGGQPAVSQVIMCDDRGNVTAAGGNSAARLFVVTPLGRATILRDQGRIAALGDCP